MIPNTDTIKSIESELDIKDPNKFGVFIGRFCPIHKGHQETLNIMLEECGNNCILLIGSCNAEWTLRNFFTYRERRNFIRKLYPELLMVGLPDFDDDAEWLIELIDILEAVIGTKVHLPTPKGWRDKPPIFQQEGNVELVFYGGSIEDTSFLKNQGFNIRENNRYVGQYNVSAQEMRDALIHGRACDSIDSRIIHDVQRTFIPKWEEFKKK